jgi:endonuclease/exonuclease/phosphatase family metal-dependent hydrolase
LLIAAETESPARGWLLAATAVALVLGVQCWRVLLPVLVWHWGATRDVAEPVVALLIYLPLLLALAGLLAGRRIGVGRGLWLAGGGLLLFRLALQASTTATADTWASLLGTGCFLWLLLLLYGQARQQGAAGWSALALGIIAGLGLDSALRGLTGTLELSRVAGLWPYAILLALAALLAAALRRMAAAAARPPGIRLREEWSLLGLGLLLFLHWQLLQNQGWLAELGGLSPAAALGAITAGNAGALLAAAHTLGSEPRRGRGLALLAGSALLLGVTLAAAPGRAAVAGFVVALPAAGAVLALLGGAAKERPAAGSGLPAGLALWLGLLLFPSLLLFYYYSLIAPLLPFGRALLAPLAGAGVGLCAVAASRRGAPGSFRAAPYRPALALGALLLLAAAAVVLAGRPASAPPPAAGYPVRVMSYNIRAAYGPDGRQDVEAVAATIATSGAGVVGLQELSRGWFVNGSSDLLALLAQRLEMPYMVMGPAMDPVAGNAILSRYPILESGYELLPLAGALVPRGAVWARLDLGGGETLLIINTHLDADEASIRSGQLAALLATWPAGSRTVFLGDMNAEPGSGEIEMILRAGYVDAGPEGAVMSTHADHEQRIDWIFHTADLAARDAAIIPSRASDHLPVVATLDRRR